MTPADFTAPILANSAPIAVAERLVLRGGRWQQRQLWVRHGLYPGAREGLVLIDTGYTPHAVSGAGRSAALGFYRRVLRPQLLPEAFPASHGLRTRDITTTRLPAAAHEPRNYDTRL